jgi:predicted acetyltransferase
VRGDELDEFAAVLEIAAGRHPRPGAARPPAAPDRTLAVFDGDRMVGGTASEPRELTIPGGAVLPAAKITLTGLLPGYRGTGAASELMRLQLPDLRARGEAAAILTTAQSGVPGRHGFGVATTALAARLIPGPAAMPTPARAPAAPLAPAAALAPGRGVRLIGADEARLLLPAIFDAHRRRQPGQVSRPPGFWASWFDDDPLLRTAGGGRFAVVSADGDSAPDGYLTYRLIPGPLRQQPVRELVIEDLITVTDQARRALWRFCCGFDQAALVSAWNLPADEPLAWIVPEPQRPDVTGLRPFLRLRLLDVAAALAARSYASAGNLVLQISDPVLAGHDQRYLLQGGPDGAECGVTTRGAELALAVGELASAYLGQTAFTALATAGRVTELAAGALRRADAMFGWHPAPWTVTDW